MSVRLSKTTTDGSSFSGTAQQTSLTQNYYGEGVPAGGSTNQVLQKLSGTSYDTGWATLGEVTGVTAGTNLNGGGTEGTVTLNLDTNITGDITFDGNVGIGTTSPESTSTLQIQNTSANNEILFSGASHTNIYSATTAGFDLGTTSSGGSSYVRFLTENTERLRIDSSGRVGIGTASPAQTLHVEGEAYFSTASGGELLIDNSGASGILLQQQNGGDTTSGSLNISSGTATLFTVNGSERIRIDSSGSVGIGTTSPARELHVISSGQGVTAFESTGAGLVIQGDASATDQIEIVGYKQGSASYHDIHIRTDATAAGLIVKKTTGNVGIGTASPSEALDVNGTANVTSLKIGGTAVTSSAAELNYSDGVTSNIQTQLDAKQATVTAGTGLAFTGATLNAEVTQSELDAKQDTLTFNAVSSNNTNPSTSAQIKTYVDGEVSNLIDSAPAALDTLNELAAALGDDANYASTVTTSLAGKQDVLSEGAFANGDKTKLDGIESSATADQTGAEIKTAYEAESDTNAFTDADHTKLDGIESSADVTDTANVTSAGALMDSELTDLAGVKSVTVSTLQVKPSEGAFVDGDKTKLDGIEASATADQTGAEIKSLYEGESDTNAFTDADHSKLDGIEASATADQTDAEIRTAVEAATDSNVFTDADHTKLDGIAASANNYSHPNHSGEVTSTGDGATVVADDVIDEANLKVDNSPTDDYVLTAKASAAGGLTWAEASGGGASAAGSAGQIQFNNGSGNLAADANLHWDDTNNRLGIGKDDPSYPLHVHSATNTHVVFSSDSNTSDSAITALWLSHNYTTSAQYAGLIFDADNMLRLNNSAGSNDSHLTIDTSGYVGIGTAAPSRLLHLSSSGGTFVRLDTGEGDDFSVGANSNGWSVYNETDSSYSLVVDGSGKVGIGTTSPSDFHSSGNRLVVGDGAGEQGLTVYSSSSSNGVINFADSDSGAARYVGRIYYEHSSNKMQFSVDGATRSVITSTGLGVGTTSPSETLSVVGDGSFTKSAGYTELKLKRTGSYSGTDPIGNILFYADTDSVGGLQVIRDGADDAAALQFFTQPTGGANSERMRIDSSGNVGIGTASPDEKLTLRLGNDEIFEIQSSAQELFQLWKESTTEEARMNIKHDGATKIHLRGNGISYFNGGNIGIGTTAPSQKLDCRGNANFEGANANLTINATSAYPYINMEENGTVRYQQAYDVTNNEFYFTATESGSEMWFGTANAERMRIDSAGNVGIGTASPSSKLQVVGGTVRVDGGQGLEFGGTAEAIYGSSASSYLAFYANSAERMRIESDGNIHLPSDSTETLLKIDGNSSTAKGIRIKSENAGGIIYAANASIAALRFGVTTDDSTITEVARFNASGNLGLGTTAPNANSKLEIAGRLRIGDGSAALPALSFSDSGDYDTGIFRASGDVMGFSTGGSERMRVDSNGYVGIGTAPSERFHTKQTGFYSTFFERDGGTTGTQGWLKIGMSSLGGSGADALLDAKHSLGFRTNGSAGTATLAMTIDDSQNIGIGTTAPTAKLEISGSGTLAKFTGTGTSTYLKITDSTSAGGNFIGATGDSLHFWADNEKVVTFKESSGSPLIGIGTDTPSAELDCVGQAVFGGSGHTKLTTYTDASYSGIYNGSSLTSDESFYFGAGSAYWYTDGAERMRIDSNGAFGIGGANYGTSGQVLVSGGSGSAPAWQDNVAGESASHWVESGSNVYRSSGKAGIGTSSPTTGLDVVGGATISSTGWSSSATANSLVVDNNSGTSRFFAVGADATTDGSYLFYTGQTDGGTNARMSILADGKIGIGTTAPSHKLEIADSGNTLLNINGSGTNTYLKITDSSSSGGNFIGATGDTLHFWTDNTQAVTIDGSQRVGIGTTSPSDLLTVGDGTNSVGITINKSDAGTGTLEFESAGTDKCYVRCNASEDLIFGTGDSDRVSILSGGNVGIGTTTPSQALHVAGKLMLDDSNDGYIYLGNDHDQYIKGDAGSNWMALFTANSERMRIDSSGNVGIGTNAPDQALVVKGIIETQASNSTNGWMMYTHTDDTLRFNYNGAGNDEIVVDSSGNVGIGCTAESTSTLQIQNSNSNNEIVFSGSDHTNIYSNTTAGFDLGTTSSSGSSYVRFLTENSERMRIDSSGNLGLGTTSPAYKTQIVDSSNCILSIVSGASSEASLYLGDSVATRGRIKYNNSDDTLDIYTNNNHRQTYTDEGQVYSPVLDAGSSATTDIDFNKNNLQKWTCPSSGSLELTASAHAAGKRVKLLIDMSNTSETEITVPSGWTLFGGSQPDLLNGAGTVLVELISWGTGDSDVTAEWDEDTGSGGGGGGEGGEGP